MIKNTKKENTTTLLGINILPLDKRPIRLLPQNLTNLGLVQRLAILVEDSAPHTQTSPHAETHPHNAQTPQVSTPNSKSWN